MAGVDLPRGLDREHVRHRDRDHTLRGSETRTLTTVGAFRVVPAGDLRDRFERPLEPRQGELWHLREAGLVRTVPLAPPQFRFAAFRMCHIRNVSPEHTGGQAVATRSRRLPERDRLTSSAAFRLVIFNSAQLLMDTHDGIGIGMGKGTRLAARVSERHAIIAPINGVRRARRSQRWTGERVVGRARSLVTR